MFFYRLLRHTYSSVKHNITIRHHFHQQQALWRSKITTPTNPGQKTGSFAQDWRERQKPHVSEITAEEQAKINNTLQPRQTIKLYFNILPNTQPTTSIQRTRKSKNNTARHLQTASQIHIQQTIPQQIITQHCQQEKNYPRQRTDTRRTKLPLLFCLSR